MEAPDGSPPQSLCMIRAAELFPKPQMEKEDTQLSVPFKELDGESVKYLGRTDDGILAISNYRIFLLKNSNNSETSVPLGLIETAQTRDLFHLILNCKDASTVKCSFETAEQCSEWQRRIQTSIGIPDTLEQLFAFPFCSWTCEARSAAVTPLQNGGHQQNGGGSSLESNPFFNNVTTNNCTAPSTIVGITNQESFERLQRSTHSDEDFMHEVERLGFDLHGPWRITNANQDFKLCPSYPQKLLVPCCISDETLQTVANFRGSRRLPVVVWRHRKSGAVLARCSQPEVGWLGWRNYKDEQLLKAIADACAFDRGEQMRRMATPATQNTANTSSQQQQQQQQQNLSSGDVTPSSPDSSHEEVAMDEVRKVLIVDARSYTSAVTNRARGGGCECIEYYPSAEIEFMNLGNIHVIRKSFHALRQLCASPPDVPNWLGTLEKTMWLQHLSGLLAASMTVCHAIEKKGRPVLVHCSDGWDRTPQIVATAQLCLDPYYRTVEGFRVLVEREWLSYGHKFSDRCGHGPNSDELNERCPVFLQWLDLVHQIHKQFPCSFEFSMAYLIKLVQHSLSCLFGTFLCNTLKERLENSVFERTFSVWPFLSGSMYRNPLYIPQRDKVLWPAYNVRDLSLWTEVYLGSLGNQNAIDYQSCNMDGITNSINPMFKTRSYGDLITNDILQNGLSRRSSDPNMTVDGNLTTGSTSENDSVADLQSEREDSPDLIANIAYDTSRKLQDLTTELNNEDEEQFNYFQHKIHNTNKAEENAEKLAVKLSEAALHSSRLQAYDKLSEKLEAERSVTNKIVKNNESVQEELTGCDLQETSYTNSSSFPIQTITTNDDCITQLASSDAVNTANNLTSTLLPENKDRVTEQQNGFYKLSSVKATEHEKLNTSSSNVNVLPTNTLDSDFMQSIDLSGAAGPNVNSTDKSPCNGLTNDPTAVGCLDIEQNLWHNSVNTSTDTLVPIENKQTQLQSTPLKALQQSNETNDAQYGGYAVSVDETDGANSSSSTTNTILTTAAQRSNATTNESSSSSMTNSAILPKVHSVRPNNLLATISTTPAALSSSTNGHAEHQHQFADNTAKTMNTFIRPTSAAPVAPDPTSTNAFTNSVVAADSVMEESIMILPVHQKLEISLNGKCETVNQQQQQQFNHLHMHNYNNMTAVNGSAAMPAFPNGGGVGFGGVSAQRRQRTLSSNSRRADGMYAAQQRYANSSTSRFSLPGMRSLPLTPPGSTERQQLAISCPDGLAHALSEQNIRLQQIVYEHKLREESLRREIHDMRVALLKKQCPNCNNVTVGNEEQCSVMDNIENASICSWEAVDDRSGPSSCTSSSTQPNNTTSVLWVPDHAVSRCTSCQTEFWLGRRKHHCRSCGQIFCADCSEFWAPLPLEKLFTPVRLCGPCYHNETTRMQMSQFQTNSILNHIQQQQQQQQNLLTSSKSNNTNALGLMQQTSATSHPTVAAAAAAISPPQAQPQPAAATSKA